MDVNAVVYRVDPTWLKEEQNLGKGLLEEIEQLKAMMVDVATGGARIDSVNWMYRERYQRIHQALRELGLNDPNPYSGLWDWYGKWRGGDLPSYQSRREYVSELYRGIVKILEEPARGGGVEFGAEPTGWPRVDRTLGEVRGRLEEAQSEEQFQAVGLLCRELMISLAQTVYEEGRHLPTDGIAPSATDAKRMLDYYLGVEMAGKGNEEARRHAQAALALANALQHRRTAEFRDAALCAEATGSVVNIIAIISGKRDPEGKG